MYSSPTNDCLKRSDGGGIRGYFSLLILKLLLEEIKEAEYNAEQMLEREQAGGENSRQGFEGHWQQHTSADTVNPGSTSTNRRFRIENANLCHYFDHIGGVSAGG